MFLENKYNIVMLRDCPEPVEGLSKHDIEVIETHFECLSVTPLNMKN
jgi:hypothetical protein